MSDILHNLVKNDDISLYEIETESKPQTGIKRFIVSTPQTRSICNDPLVAGTNYTNLLQAACTNVLKHYDFGLKELNTVVLNILRGSLNFGLRDALSHAYGWTRHNTSFISAQRACEASDPERWHITEKGYKKVFFPPKTSLVMGDVVATGTSLNYALNEIITQAYDQRVSIRNILFFTYGGIKAEEIFQELDERCRKLYPNYCNTYVIYLEGRFTVPNLKTPLSIRLIGTDLLRYKALMAPEFIESQYEQPSYPLERCIIYDAGSRAFWIPEYVADVKNYWHQTYELARQGVTFKELLHERFPEIDASRFAETDLMQLCNEQIEKMDKFFG